MRGLRAHRVHGRGAATRGAGRRAVAAALGVAVVTLLAACGGQDETTAGGDGQADEQESGDATTVTGALAGDADLEGGCAWLETDEGSVEVLWPEGYRVTFEPLRLRGPGGDVVAEAGEDVTVSGEFAEDRMSICQVGDIFAASAVVE